MEEPECCSKNATEKIEDKEIYDPKVTYHVTVTYIYM